MKNICFVSNFKKTELFIEVSKYFQKENIFWICVNLKELKKVSAVYDDSNILFINKKNIKNEQFNSELKINEIIFADRSLDNKNDLDKQFILNSEKKIYEFIKNKNIEYIFGEFTWAHEVIINLVCKNNKDLNCKYLNPGAIRIIPGKFLFFESLDNSKYFTKKKLKESEIFNIEKNKYKNYIENFTIENKIFNFKLIINKILKIILNDYYDRYDPRKISKTQRIINFICKYFNFITFKMIKKISLNDVKSNKYIIYYLQKKPEASTDVKGIYYSDQIINIQNIWKILPINTKLLIKQHPTCKGDNNYFFYKKITLLNDTYILDDKINDNFLNRKPLATFSINSTASMESAISGIPSFTFVNCFFNELKFSERINLEDLKKFNLDQLILNMNLLNESKHELNEIKFLKSSYKGHFYGDELMTVNNIKNISDAINEIIN